MTKVVVGRLDANVPLSQAQSGMTVIASGRHGSIQLQSRRWSETVPLHKDMVGKFGGTHRPEGSDYCAFDCLRNTIGHPATLDASPRRQSDNCDYVLSLGRTGPESSRQIATAKSAPRTRRGTLGDSWRFLLMTVDSLGCRRTFQDYLRTYRSC